MNRRMLWCLSVLLLGMLLPAQALAASELELKVSFASPVMEGEGAQTYEWRLENNSPFDVQEIYLRANEQIIQKIGELESGESASGRGVLQLTAEDMGRRIYFIADGYTEIPNEDKSIEQKKITRHVESACNAVAYKSGAAAEREAPLPPMMKLPSEIEEESFEIEACAFAQKSAMPSDMENELAVFIKNNGNTDATGLLVQLGKDTAAQAERLPAGESLALRCPFTPQSGKAARPVLKYVNNKGKTLSKKLDPIEFYQEDKLLQLSLRAEMERPTPQKCAGLYIEIRNTGEKAISGIKLFDYRGNPVQTPKSKLKAGETMRVYTQIQLQRETELAYYAQYKNKATVVSASPSIRISPQIPEGTAQMQLRAVPDKGELHGTGRDRVTFTCTLANNGSYPLSAVLLMHGEQVIGSCDMLPPGEERVFKCSYLLTGAKELLFVATAADETGVLRECSAVAAVRAGDDFIKTQE